MTVTRKARSIPLASMVLALAACSAQSDANADTGNRAASNSPPAKAASAQPSSATVRPVTLPPAALAAWESYARQECRVMEGRFAPTRFTPLVSGDEADSSGHGGFVSADFNADGQPDFVAVTSDEGCRDPDGAPGSGAVDFIVSTAGGYRAFEGFAGHNAFSFDSSMVKRRNDRAVLEFPGGFFGNCGEVAVAVWGWNDQKMDIIERRNSKGQTVDQEGCAVTARSAAPAAAGGSSFPPIEPGYWAGGVSCAEAIEEVGEVPAGQESLYYLDARGGQVGWFEIQRYAALGGNRYRMIGRDHDENGSSPGQMDITVTSRTSFTDSRYGGRYTHCPTSTIPRAVRADYEGR